MLTIVFALIVMAACGHPSPSGSVAPARLGMSARGLSFEESGRGEPIVLIHAFQMDRREWDEIAPVLSTHRRVIRYDVRGHGRSRGVEGPYAAHEDLAALFGELGLARADVVGLSMGSTIALEFAVAHPELVRRVVMISPGLPGIRVDAPRDWMAPIMTAVRGRDGARAAELWWESPIMAGTRARGADGLRYRQVVLDNGRIWTQDPTAQRPLDPPAAQGLASLGAPLLVITGSRDITGARQQADSIASRLPTVRRLTMDGGHMLSTERPAELARAVEAFLR
jgi:pimeloyl-ACP methyl ester carboxylesterase